MYSLKNANFWLVERQGSLYTDKLICTYTHTHIQLFYGMSDFNRHFGCAYIQFHFQIKWINCGLVYDLRDWQLLFFALSDLDAAYPRKYFGLKTQTHIHKKSDFSFNNYHSKSQWIMRLINSFTLLVHIQCYQLWWLKCNAIEWQRALWRSNQ